MLRRKLQADRRVDFKGCETVCLNNDDLPVGTPDMNQRDGTEALDNFHNPAIITRGSQLNVFWANTDRNLGSGQNIRWRDRDMKKSTVPELNTRSVLPTILENSGEEVHGREPMNLATNRLRGW